MGLFRKKATGVVIRYVDFDSHWDTEDPFLFVSHHCDKYPKGNSQQAPPRDMIGWRNLGHDYEKYDGFRMYNGKVVPGFPMHSHWGYETFTVAEEGFIDTFDTEGNQSRFGFGDAQWVTASSKYQHCEMYPLAFQDRPNTNNITQIMINLPVEMKGSLNSVAMLWLNDINTLDLEDDYGRKTRVIVYAGTYDGVTTLVPNPNSWAADPNNGVKIVQFYMEPESEFILMASSDDVARNLYFVSGTTINVEGFVAESSYRLKLKPDADIKIKNGDLGSCLWLLEGTPIKEKMSSFGPVILKNDKDVRAAMKDIRENEYKLWPWDVVDKVQPLGSPRFIKYADGREEYPDGKPEGFEPVRTKSTQSNE